MIICPQIVSAVRAGIPDELRGQLWRGFSGAGELQRRAELKRAIRKVSKTTSIRPRSAGRSRVPVASAGIGTTERLTGNPAPDSLYDEYSTPIDIAQANTPEGQMLFARLCALALQDSGHVAVSLRPSELHPFDTRLNRAISDLSSPSERGGDRNSLFHDEYAGRGSGNDMELENAIMGGGGGDDDDSKSDGERNSLKQLEKSKLGTYVYPSDYPAAEWEHAARRRVLLATSRYKYASTCLLVLRDGSWC